MSELAQTNRQNFRWELLATVSTLALMTCIASTPAVLAEDSDRPTVWVELGGQMEFLQGTSNAFTAPFMAITPDPSSYDRDIFSSNQRPAHLAFGLEGTINFQPEDSNWLFSASLRYGRAHAKRHDHQQGDHPIAHKYGQTAPIGVFAAPFADVTMPYEESHTVLDFSAGKDIGIGMLGREGVSTLSVGIRFAQFSADSTVGISARPNIGYAFRPRNNIPFATFYQYFLTGDTARNFRGVGPSLSWNASSALLGNAENAEVTLDWGMNAAVLFGRQKADVRHGTKAYHLTQQSRKRSGYPLVYSTGNSSVRSHSAVVPNLGGFAGISMRYPNAKVSFGYRADFFFGAMDTGTDTRRTSDLGFHGPFATLSIGLGG